MIDILGFSCRLPLVLLLLPLALLPLFVAPRRADGIPALDAIPADPVSRAVDRGLRIAGAVAMAALVLAGAGLQRSAGEIERIGRGGHIALLIDRSGSMNDSFAGRTPQGSEEAKAATARRLIDAFVVKRARDRIGMIGFSTSPMLLMPMTDRTAAVRAAIAAIDRPGLAYTDVGRGLARALDMLDEDPGEAARSILLVSDGAAVIDRKVQADLRDAFSRRRVNLYWLYLRTAGSRGIFAPPPPDMEDNPQVLPERHLNLFLASLRQPYRAFEAESPEAVAAAIAEIDKLEVAEMRYRERIPAVDLVPAALGIALGALALLLAARLMEVRVGGSRKMGAAP
ncbi:hypothetical protein ABB55_18510 [Prosthecomicrobium hirschii]|uniref:VWFA domain-containing protein n=1 Tax=Prosthecodimorpha hirschii TaxID=665126 RepID=A0A0P6VMK6_9HYPH|nr:vWA domain-containing protein [Prosthecomicrobium hirschii]KPL53955.1 hypothetical protein ABB55_18510 [Prosthecomicrobium hirschii]